MPLSAHPPANHLVQVDVLVNGAHVAEMGDGSYLGEIAALGLATKSDAYARRSHPCRSRLCLPG